MILIKLPNIVKKIRRKIIAVFFYQPYNLKKKQKLIKKKSSRADWQRFKNVRKLYMACYVKMNQTVE